jgi:predicted lipoprotein with Yx(FWY)xxD motif
MRTRFTTTAIAIAVAAAAAVGGVTVVVAAGSSTPNYSAPPSTAGGGSVAGVRPSNRVTVHTATATVQGKSETILVDAKGLPLYIYKPDTPTTSRVSGQLAALWPPLIAHAPNARGATGTLTSVETPNGGQVAYNGHFLYTFTEDSSGRVTGQGVQNFFVATPDLSTGSSSDMQGAPAPSSNNSGY